MRCQLISPHEFRGPRFSAAGHNPFKRSVNCWRRRMWLVGHQLIVRWNTNIFYSNQCIMVYIIVSLRQVKHSQNNWNHAFKMYVKYCGNRNQFYIVVIMVKHSINAKTFYFYVFISQGQNTLNWRQLYKMSCMLIRFK